MRLAWVPQSAAARLLCWPNLGGWLDQLISDGPKGAFLPKNLRSAVYLQVFRIRTASDGPNGLR